LETVNVVIQPFGLRATGLKGQTLYEVCRSAGIELTSVCGGLGSCGKCRVVVTGGRMNITGPSETEQEHLSSDELSSGVRLACQVGVQGAIEILVPRESAVARVRLQMEGIERKVKPLPLVKKYFAKLPRPTLGSLEPDLERLRESLPEDKVRRGSLPLEILRLLPEILRNANWKITATVWNKTEILDVEAGDTTNACYGLAVDIGTTKMVCYLVNLTDGKTVTLSSMVNPQILYGEDVIARIAHSLKGEKEKGELQERVLKGVNRLIAECCSKHGINAGHIYEATMVGNTAMHHLLLGVSPRNLALSPYVPAVKSSLNLKAKDLGLQVNPHANVYFLPVIAGFVGSDCVADILASRIFSEEDICLLLDIGTNTEVVVGNKKRLLACSCASGPAFEGAHIKYGMKASSGAIESAQIDAETLEVRFKTIDDREPRGLCGSGIVDIVAGMVRARIIDENGTIRHDADTQRIRVGKSGIREFIVVQTGEEEAGDIVVTQEDMREIQLAKAAIRTGISILMQEVNTKLEQIGRVYMAGAFGSYVDPTSARIIGMIPSVPLSIVTSVGNAAGTGARMALVSSKARRICERISRSVEYIELATHSNFRSTFAESLRFPHR